MVSLFGMKWSILNAQSVIDRFVQRYHAQMTSTVPTGRNLFHNGAQYFTDVVLLFRFNNQQYRVHKFMEVLIHNMCNESNYGLVECRPFFYLHLLKIKIYQKVIHDILSQIPRRTLDGVPDTTFIVRTRIRLVAVFTTSLDGYTT